jgi:hypothetical protein
VTQPAKCNHPLTINRGLSRQDDDDELQPLVGVLEVAEHGLHLVGARGVLAETRLTHDGHARIVGDALKILREVSEDKNIMENASKILIHCRF